MKTITVKTPFFSMFGGDNSEFYAGLFLAIFGDEAEISYENGTHLVDEVAEKIDASTNYRAASSLIEGLRFAIHGYENHLVFKANGDENNIDRYNSLFD